MVIYRFPTCARSGSLKATNVKNSGVMVAVVLPFRVADTKTMQRESVYTYTITESPGANIHALRKERDWSQRALADKCNPPLDHTTIRRLEHNEGFTQDSLEKVAKALGVVVKDLFLPPELAEYTILPEEVKMRIAASVQDAAAAVYYRKKKSS